MDIRVIAILVLLLLPVVLFHAELDHIGMKGLALDLSNGPVHNVNTGLNYSLIQDAISAPQTIDGHAIRVDPGTYFEHLIVNKSLAIIGSGRDVTIIDGLGGIAVTIVANKVQITGFTMWRALLGIKLDHSNDCVVSENNVTGIPGQQSYAIYALLSNNCTIDHNFVGPNLGSGILVSNAIGFRISGNYAFNNSGGYGLNANASTNGLIAQNYGLENGYDGIGLGKGCTNCTITGNNVTGNLIYGIWLDSDSGGNVIYENNIIDNGKQASVFLQNTWDNGIEGNYWNDYTGSDQNRDGIGDTPYPIDENHTDNLPLMGMLTFFETGLGSQVEVVSNASITDFAYFESNSSIKMHVIKATPAQTSSFCRIRIPHSLMTQPYNVTIDGALPPYSNYTLFDDGSSRWIYFTCQLLPSEVQILGSPGSIPTGGEPFLYWIAGVTAIVLIAAVVLLYFRKLRKRKSNS